MDTNLKLFLLVFRFLGLTEANNSKKQWFWLINVISVAIIVALITICYMEKDKIYHVGSFIGLLLDIIQVVLPLICHLTLILEAIIKQNVDKSLRELMKNIDTSTNSFSFRNLSICNDNSKKYIQMWFVTTGFILFTILPEFWVFGSGWRPFPKWIESIAIRFLSKQIQKINLMYFLTLMVFIQNTMCLCREELKHGCDAFENRIDNVKNCLIQHFQLEELIRNRFSWSLILFIINDFISLTIGLYFIITRIYYGGSDHLIGLEGNL